MANQIKALGKYGAAVSISLFLVLYFSSALGVRPPGLQVNEYMAMLFGSIMAFLTNGGGGQE